MSSKTTSTSIRHTPSICAVLVAMTCALLLAACSSAPTGSKGPTRSTRTKISHPTTTAPTTTTTVPTPTAPQPSADQATNDLVSDWASGNMAAALTVATPSAVSSLFAIPYPGSGLAIDRGCATTFAPVTCTYGPPGGANPNDAIYSFTLQSAANGWY